MPCATSSLLSRGGLVPVLVTPGTSTALLARLDGLVIPGGPDIAPARYGAGTGTTHRGVRP